MVQQIKRNDCNQHNNIKMEQPQINLSDSDDHFNDSQLQMFLNIKRSRSNDSLLSELINGSPYQKRSLVFDFTCNLPQNQSTQKVTIFKPRLKKPKLKKQCDYRKNICGYITKKVIREYLGPTYKIFTQKLCQKHRCTYQESKSYYLNKIEKITGPSHISALVIPNNQKEITIKAAFKEFFIWFLTERYLRYLILEGKMDQKKAYIDYKNSILMNLIKAEDTKETSCSEMGDSLDLLN